MQHRGVADMAVGLQDHTRSRRGVHHAIILNVTALAYRDRTQVATQHRVWPNVTVGPDADVADDADRFVDIGRWMYYGHPALELIQRHVQSLHSPAPYEERTNSRCIDTWASADARR